MLQVVATCWAISPGFCCHCFVARFFSCHWWSVFFQDLGSKDINADAYLVAHIVRIGGSHKIINCAQIILWTRDEELLCDNTEEPSCNEPLYNDTSVNRTIFFTPVIVKLMETTLVVANICQFLVPSLKQLESEAANILLEKKKSWSMTQRIDYITQMFVLTWTMHSCMIQKRANIHPFWPLSWSINAYKHVSLKAMVPCRENLF